VSISIGHETPSGKILSGSNRESTVPIE
jgi:hypothetical protein